MSLKQLTVPELHASLDGLVAKLKNVVPNEEEGAALWEILCEIDDRRRQEPQVERTQLDRRCHERRRKLRWHHINLVPDRRQYNRRQHTRRMAPHRSRLQTYQPKISAK